MKISGFGGYPSIDSNLEVLEKIAKLQEFLASKKPFIARGNGRSYGDSSLSKNILLCKPYDEIHSFCQDCGILHAQCGVMLDDILDFSMPKGFFLHVTPGTQYITLGGAIASNVHGKNHHHNNYSQIEELDSKANTKINKNILCKSCGQALNCVELIKGGNFIESVLNFSLMLPNGDIMQCSRDLNSDLFYATFGGMGLTGIILEARIRLRKVSSSKICQTTIKTNNLSNTMEYLESHKQAPYAVAWIDSLAKDKNLGRGIVSYGDFALDSDFNYNDKRQNQITSNIHTIEDKKPKSNQKSNEQYMPQYNIKQKAHYKAKLKIPFYLPNSTLNPFSVGIFNKLYYSRAKNGQKLVYFKHFFYPLDSILSWNKIYGRNGFLQYQIIIPKDSTQSLHDILNLIAESKQGSFLNVLKLYGKEDSSFLCFPLEGYSLALDFKNTPSIFGLLDRLDEIVTKCGGRIYLTKDSRMSKHIFDISYKRANEFRELRKDYGLDSKIESLQSKRLGI
ncbi:FAD-binding oxidoreductase [Helicobacter muridarum]|uniref:FAD-binding oxidoreductase n=1 Tax=Helicobacter muridarum TaxID=216 RepID=A0A377PTJ3_9HELI|nr:FAD-binding oxidoreductase [Helicobacter muridarum]TLE01631.1 FAD-binding oxidoreductase [Helicobacter muridarum]STQ86248.1 Probable decaprenylphosphoryl-beta-D-ribose oxidase [Helicobacter muridarum]